MSNRLAGTLFVRNGIEYDYCHLEAIKSLLEFCDHVFVLDAGSTDGTDKTIIEIESPKLTFIRRLPQEWEEQEGTGKTKLCYFTDLVIDEAEKNGYEYQVYCQADEIIHENSYQSIWDAVGYGAEAYLINRINLWKYSYLQLNVPESRMPCSSHVIRLAKTKYRSYGDAESINAPAISDFGSKIKMYHMGFVRDRKVMKNKIINMQEKIFELGHHDPKLDQEELFNPDLWFNPHTELKLIYEPLPKNIVEWARQRDEINSIEL